mgnify:CR=1 FL=1
MMSEGEALRHAIRQKCLYCCGGSIKVDAQARIARYGHIGRNSRQGNPRTREPYRFRCTWFLKCKEENDANG